MGVPLQGRTIAITADRRAGEQAELFVRRGATVLHGPTMATLDLRQDRSLRDLTVSLIDQPPDWLVATTGMGMRYWAEAAEGWGLSDQLLAALGSARIVARGAKATSQLRRLGLEPEWRAPSEQMREVHAYLTSHDLSGARVAVQLFDDTERLEWAGLQPLAAEAVAVPVYRWQLPDDPTPALELIDAVLAGRVDAVTFTSQPAARYLFRLARLHRGESAADALRDALNGSVLAVCIGPVCAEALEEEGVTATVWPEPNRLVPMAKLVVDHLGTAPPDTVGTAV